MMVRVAHQHPLDTWAARLAGRHARTDIPQLDHIGARPVVRAAVTTPTRFYRTPPLAS